APVHVPFSHVPFARKLHYNSNHQSLTMSLSAYGSTGMKSHIRQLNRAGFYYILSMQPSTFPDHQLDSQRKPQTTNQKKMASRSASAYNQELTPVYVAR